MSERLVADAVRGVVGRLAPQLEGKLTVSVPVAGEVLGLGRGAAYRAVGRGEIPSLTFAGRKVVPVIPLLELVGASLDDLDPTVAGDPSTEVIPLLRALPERGDTA